MSEAKRIAANLRKTFEQDAWHGPAVMEVLQDISADDVFKKSSGSHSIIQLVAHMTAWRAFAIARLEGDIDFDITSDEMNFPSSTDWKKVLDDLKESQERLVKLLESVNDENLNELVAGRKYSFYTLLHGIIQHDIYHLGQIQLIKKYC